MSDRQKLSAIRTMSGQDDEHSARKSSIFAKILYELKYINL
jgi:hypothetical protein